MAFSEADTRWMWHALSLAKRARDEDEVPIGAVLVYEDKLIGEGYNQPIQHCDPTAHAEIMAIRAAAKALGNYRLTGCTLYTTLEPCLMCAGSLTHSRITRLVYATADPRMGAANTVFQVLEHPALNHRVKIESGLLQEEASQLLKDFFEVRR